MTAATPANANASLAGVLEFPNEKLYLYLHFSEIQVLKANESREFEIFWNKKLVYNAYSPVYLQTKTIRNPAPVTCEGGECILEMIKTERSTLPPLLNAVEVFTVVEFPQPETDASDGKLASGFTIILNAKSNRFSNVVEFYDSGCYKEHQGHLWIGSSHMARRSMCSSTVFVERFKL